MQQNWNDFNWFLFKNEHIQAHMGHTDPDTNSTILLWPANVFMMYTINHWVRTKQLRPTKTVPWFMIVTILCRAPPKKTSRWSLHPRKRIPGWWWWCALFAVPRFSAFKSTRVLCFVFRGNLWSNDKMGSEPICLTSRSAFSVSVFCLVPSFSLSICHSLESVKSGQNGPST